MNLSKKFIGLFMLILFAFVVIGCGDTTTQAPTTAAPTTQAPTTQAPTTQGPTSDVTTTEEETNTEPMFVGLFTKQTYYKGSQEYDILAGAKAIDAEDGELPITTIGAYTTTRTGKYEVFAVAEDSDGNIITELITLTVKDLTAYSIPTELTSDPIEIELWHSNGATIENALNQYAEDFEELYPNITVTITKNGNNYDELRENMVNAIRGGQIPNIIQNYPDHVMEYIDNNGVIPLTPFIYHPVHGYNPAVEEESFMDILLSYRRENSQYTTDGEFYSVPFNKSTEVMIYNKTMFDILIANGVIDEVPNTWQGLFALSDELYAIKDQVIDQITTKLNQSTTLSLHKTTEEIQAIKDNFVPITYDSPANAFITLTRQWGGEYTAIDASRNGVILFDNDQTKAMLSFFFDNRDDAFTLPGKWGTEYASDAFKVGQTAVTFGSTGGARYNTPAVVNNQFVFEFGVMPMPYNEDMPGERTAIQQGTNMSITTAGNDQEKLASWLFLKYLTSKAIQLDFALQTGYSPVRYSVYETDVYNDFREGIDASGNPIYGEDLMKSLAANAAAQQSDFLFYDQAFIGSSKARSEVEAAFERVILGSLEGTTKEQLIADALAAAKANAERVLN
jgi:ABC-type glycerol-3-phosphate transport system substrate-binding protein